MDEVLRVGCKVNLGLRITGVREDGYHTIDSLFWPLDAPHDIVHCAPAPGDSLRVECAGADIDPASNTLTRAYAAFAAASGFAPGLRVRLTKGIPTGAGLGGGSADAAALLRYLQARAPAPLAPAALHAVAASVGADVPFFLYNTPCRVRGMGENIAPCAPAEIRVFAGLTLLCLCPPVHVSTPWAYAAWDAAHAPSRDKNTPRCLTTPIYNAKETDSCATHLVNDFESVVFARYPQLRSLKESLLVQGAACAVMSGSGASMLGLFRSKADAHRVSRQAARDRTAAFVSDLTPHNAMRA